MRTKYRFRSRQEAEDAHRQAEREGHQKHRFALALLKNAVVWTAKRHGIRAGVFDHHTCVGAKVALVQESQTASNTNLHILDPWDGDISRWEQSVVRYNDDESRAMLAVLTEVRGLLPNEQRTAA